MNDYIIVWNMQYIYINVLKSVRLYQCLELWMIMFETVHDYIYIYQCLELMHEHNKCLELEWLQSMFGTLNDKIHVHGNKHD